MPKTKDYYEILGVSRNADQNTIKRAYRKLAMQYHHDRNPGKEQWANEKFKEINEAFSVLGDPEKKHQYDQFGTVGNLGDIFSSPFISFNLVCFPFIKPSITTRLTTINRQTNRIITIVVVVL